MYKRCTSYTLVSHPPTEKTLISQQCIKSCILRKKGPWKNYPSSRVLFYNVFWKSDCVNKLCTNYTYAFI